MNSSPKKLKVFSHHHVVLNPYGVIFSVKHKIRMSQMSISFMNLLWCFLCPFLERDICGHYVLLLDEEKGHENSPLSSVEVNTMQCHELQGAAYFKKMFCLLFSVQFPWCCCHQPCAWNDKWYISVCFFLWIRKLSISNKRFKLFSWYWV